jgi:hypothetical protein
MSDKKQPTVTLNKTPSEQVAADANATHVLTDSKGRKITLKDPGILAQYRLVKMLGADTAKNEIYVNMVVPLLWVVEIDGDAVAPPATERQIEAIIQRLGYEGVAAIGAFVQEKAEASLASPDNVKN